MINEDAVRKLKDRYSDVHPLVFHRSASYAKTPGELFDILESIPKTYPIIWDGKKRTWTTIEDVRNLTTK